MLIVAGAVSGWAAEVPRRFYFSGDGVLVMGNAHNREHLRIRYRDAEGRYDAQALEQVELFFRSRTDGARGHVSLRLVELIDFVGDRAHAPALSLVSGYRSPEFNQSLRDGGGRVARASLHTEGLAADVVPAGADLRRLWLELRRLRVGGVGLYQKEGFLHLDTGNPRFWEAATSGVEKNLSADNARLFARTDFDRYDTLDGAVVSLHSLTALPVGIERQARFGATALPLLPRQEVDVEGDCYVLRQPAERYEFTVTTPLAAPAVGTSIRLETCAPRPGATPAEITTNPIERR